jgi:hypothetical protein
MLLLAVKMVEWLQLLLLLHVLLIFQTGFIIRKGLIWCRGGIASWRRAPPTGWCNSLAVD